tara:strand:- start:6031 stop:6216 length:186 start_codon:yes stop_codon:yes gene_type:complete
MIVQPARALVTLLQIVIVVMVVVSVKMEYARVRLLLSVHAMTNQIVLVVWKLAVRLILKLP